MKDQQVNREKITKDFLHSFYWLFSSTFASVDKGKRLKGGWIVRRIKAKKLMKDTKGKYGRCHKVELSKKEKIVKEG